MKKIISLLAVLFLVGCVNGADYYNPGENEKCTDTTQCQSNLYCWTKSNLGHDTAKTCHTGKGGKGDYCTFDYDCLGSLVCTRVPRKGTITGSDLRCSECDQGNYAFNGVVWYSDEENPSYKSEPQDVSCTEAEETCSCICRSNNGNKLDYCKWESNDDLTDKCWDDTDCYGDSVCNLVQDGDKRKCFSSIDMNCGSYNDCLSGFDCVDYRCQIAVTTTTVFGYTTTSSTTSTTATTTSTTTTLVPGWNCDKIYNITQAIDDGIQIHPIGKNIEDTDLGVFRTTGNLDIINTSDKRNVTLSFVFRNVDIPTITDLGSINASLYYYWKNTGDGSESGSWITEHPYAPKYLNNSDLSLAPSQTELYTGVEYTTLKNGTQIGTGVYFKSETDIFGSLTNETLTNYPIQVDIGATLQQFNPGRWKSGDNLTIYVPFLAPNTANYNLSIYSYDEDTTKSAILCVNYSISLVTDNSSECSIDSDCLVDEYCRTGWSDDKLCIRKYPNVDLESDNICYRNHECLSGYCSSHSSNGIDYPDYNSEQFPYNNHDGECRQNVGVVKSELSPEHLSIGGGFDIFTRLENVDGNSLHDKDCNVWFYPIQDTTPVTLNEAWSYSIEGNSRTTAHNLKNSQINEYWNYINENPLTVNSSLNQGYYTYYVDCREGGNIIGADIGHVRIFNANKTFLKYYTEHPINPILDDYHTISLAYININNTPITGGDCKAELFGHNTSLTNIYEKYSTTLHFNETGATYLKIFCSKAGFESISDIGSITVQPGHCDDGIKNFNEVLIDCGGDCKPCDETGLKHDFESCGYDLECLSQWCNKDYYECRTPTCNDGYLNQGEFDVDCGGGVCSECPFCLYDGMCSSDGRAYCNDATATCLTNNCTTSSDCSPFQVTENEFIELFCVNERCSIYSDNRSLSRYKSEIKPYSGIVANQSGTMLHVSNCDDANNGFEIKTDIPVWVYYKFETSTLTPSIDSYTEFIKFGGGIKGVSHKGLIPELCNNNNKGFGGFDKDQEKNYFNITFYLVEEPNKQITRSVNGLVFKKNFENSLNIYQQANETTRTTRAYLVNSTSRDIMVKLKYDLGDEFVLLTSTPKHNQIVNYSAVQEQEWITDVFYYWVNSTLGEVHQGRKGTMIPMIVDYDVEENRFTTPLKFEWWMIPLILAVLIIGLVYMAYKIRYKQEYGRGGFN